MSYRPATASCRPQGILCSSGNRDSAPGLRGGRAPRCSLPRGAPPARSESSLRPRTAGGCAAESPEPPSPSILPSPGGASSPGRKVSLTSRPYVVHIRLRHTSSTTARSSRPSSSDSGSRPYRCRRCSSSRVAHGRMGTSNRLTASYATNSWTVRSSASSAESVGRYPAT